MFLQVWDKNKELWKTGMDKWETTYTCTVTQTNDDITVIKLSKNN